MFYYIYYVLFHDNSYKTIVIIAVYDTKKTEWATQGVVELSEATLPQFTRRRKFNFKAHQIVSDSKSMYDIIMGRDILQQIGLDILYSSNEFCWDEIKVPMTPRGYWTKQSVKQFDEYEDTEKAEEAFLLDAKYGKVDLKKVVEEQTHLNEENKKILLELLQQFEGIFQGTLGRYTGDEVKIELKENVKPFHAKAYRIPHSILPVLKKEVERLERIGVVSKNRNSKCAAPSFAIPKKDMTIRFISDFRQLNKSVQRKPFPLPHIRDLLDSTGEFLWATAIDLSMSYYHIRLSSEAKDLCTIILPLGKYCYNVLLMGFVGSTNIFQHIMNNMFSDLPSVLCYLDDLIVLGSGTFEEHVAQLKEVFSRLLEKGFQVNPLLKTFWAQSEVEYLGFIISRDGIQPQPKKIQGIKALSRPTNQK